MDNSPLSGLSKVPNICNSVVLPAPDDPTIDTIVSRQNLPDHEPNLVLDGPLTYKAGNRWAEGADPDEGIITISGTKTDSLGEIGFGTGLDKIYLDEQKSINTMTEEGYYQTSDGQNYFMLDVFFSDRLTGDIYFETHPVLLDENVPLENPWSKYGDVPFNGIMDIDFHNFFRGNFRTNHAHDAIIGTNKVMVV